MNRSECCGAKVYDDTDICSECLEHCDIWEDKKELQNNNKKEKK